MTEPIGYFGDCPIYPHNIRRSTMTAPTIGRIVIFTIGAHDALAINKRRKDAESHRIEHIDASSGVIIHVGNAVAAGDTFPMLIVRVWSPESTTVQGQVFLDGNDTFWASSACQGEDTEPHTWHWPARPDPTPVDPE